MLVGGCCSEGPFATEWLPRFHQFALGHYQCEQPTVVHWQAWESEGGRVSLAMQNVNPRWQNLTHCTFKV